MDIRFEAKESKCDNRSCLNIWAKSDRSAGYSFPERLKLLVFKVFTDLYPSFNRENSDKPLNHTLSLIFLLYETIVLVTFIQSHDSWKQADSDQFKIIWDYISDLRLDRLSGVLNIFEVWLALVFAVILIPTVGLLYLVLITYFYEEPNTKYIKPFTVLCLTSIDKLFMVHIVSTLIGILKYGLLSREVVEFSYDLEIIGARFFIASLILLPIHLILTLANKLFNTETRHDLSKYVGLAKVTSYLDLLKIGIVHLIVISNYFIEGEFAWAHFLICTGLSIVGWVSYWIYLPFYQERFNALFACQYTIIGTVSFAHIVGYFQNSINVGVILSIFATPLTAYISCYIMSVRYKNLVLHLTEASRLLSERECEILIRDFLVQDKLEALEILRNTYSHPILKNSKFIALIDSYFTCNVLNDKKLARIKLNLTSGRKCSLEVEYAAYRCRKYIENDESCETLKYLKFNILYDEVMNTDQSLCECLIQIWSHLCLPKPSAELIRMKIIEIKKLLKNLKDQYLKLMSRYPTAHTLYQFYGSLINDIGNDSINGQFYLLKASQIKNEIERVSSLCRLSLFHPNSGIIVISCNPDYFGRVVYSNRIAQEMLEYTAANLHGMSFTELIPEPYKKYHLSHFRNFLAKRQQTEIKTHSNVLYLSNYSGFIIPVKCLMRLDALGAFPCMMITFIRCKNNFQIALFDETGVILSHSEDFASRLGQTDLRIMSQNLYSFLPGMENKFLMPRVLDSGFKIILLKYQYAFKYVQLAVIYHRFEEIYELDATNLSKADTDPGQPEYEPPEINLKRTNRKRGVTILTDPNIVYYSLKADSYKITNSPNTQNLDELEIPSMPSKISEDKDPSKSKKRISNASSAVSNKSGSFEITHKRFITNVIGKANNLKVVVGIAILALILANTAVTILFSQYVSMSIDIGQLEEKLNSVKLSIFMMRSHARALDLNNRQNFTQYDTQEIYNEISRGSDFLQEVSNEIEDLKAKLSVYGFYDDIFLSESILIWELIYNQQLTKKVNFLDMLELYISHSQIVLSSDPKVMNVLDPNLYFLFKNSYSDAIRSCNATLNGMSNFEKEFLLTSKNQLIYGILGVVFVMILAAGFTTHRLLHVQRSSNSVWNFLYSISYPNLIELQRKAIDRLMMVHHIEEEIRRPSLAYSKKKNRMRVNPYRSWLGVCIHLMIILVFAVFIYLYLYLISFNKTMSYISIRPRILSLNSESSINLIMVYDFAREFTIRNTPFAVRFIIRDKTLSPPPLAQFSKSISRFRTNSVNMLEILRKEDLIDDSIISSLFQETASDLTYFNLGIYYSLSTYITDMLDLAYSNLSSDSAQDFITYHDITEVLVESYEALNTDIQQKITDKITSEFHICLIMMTLFSCFLIVMWCIFVFKVVRSIKQVILSGWSFFNELNLGDLEELEKD